MPYLYVIILGLILSHCTEGNWKHFLLHGPACIVSLTRSIPGYFCTLGGGGEQSSIRGSSSGWALVLNNTMITHRKRFLWKIYTQTFLFGPSTRGKAQGTHSLFFTTSSVKTWKLMVNYIKKAMFFKVLKRRWKAMLLERQGWKQCPLEAWKEGKVKVPIASSPDIQVTNFFHQYF